MMPKDNSNADNNQGKFDLSYWSGIASVVSIPLTCIIAAFADSKSISVFIATTVSSIFLLIFLYGLAKSYIEKIKRKAELDAKRPSFENPYQSSFQTLSNHLEINIINKNLAHLKQTREVLCIRKGADEYYYRHGPAHKVFKFKHNVGKVLYAIENQGRLDIVIKLDHPHSKNEKRIFISECTFKNMYPTPHEFHTQLKHYFGPESGSYKIIFPGDKPPRLESAKIITNDNHLQPKDTINLIQKNLRLDGRIELFLPIEEYEVSVGDKVSISWDW